MRHWHISTSILLVIITAGCVSKPDWDPSGFVNFDPNARVSNPALFSHVSTSMTLGEVVALLGKPTEMTGSGMCYVHWRTRSGGRFGFTVAPEGLHRTNLIGMIMSKNVDSP